jgi:hypothetical protein
MMKVIGSGAPRVLRVRLAASERIGFEVALRTRRDALVRRLESPGEDPAGLDNHERDALAALERMADQLAAVGSEAGQVQVSGPTSTVGPLIETASQAAAEELAAAVAKVCRGEPGSLARLVGAIGPAQASASTLVSYRRIIDSELDAPGSE